MTRLIDKKFKQLESITKEEMWYIVKQNGVFWEICYGASVLEEYQLNNFTERFQDFYKNRIKQINETKKLKLGDNYRVLRYIYYFGLGKRINSKYEDLELTEVYYKIKELCNGDFEKIDSYYNIIEQQIEKLYISWDVDEQCNDLRKDYELYPLFLVYKVLIGLWDILETNYLTYDEFKLILGSTYTYNEYLKVIFIISEIRSDETKVEKLKTFRTLGHDIRYVNILKNLNDIFSIEQNKIFFNIEKIDYIKCKIKNYEQSILPSKKQYEKVLCSNISLFDFNKGDIKMNDKVDIDLLEIEENNIDEYIPRNLIIYGAPGTGKSNKIENEYRKRYFNNEYLYSRVTFNPNFGYESFIGVYKPITIYIKNNNGNEYFSANKVDKLECQMMPVIEYSFVPGAFIEVLCKALNDKKHNYLLLIEEINRADVASVFGDAFQLLDRFKHGENKGSSEYGILFSKEIMDYIAANVSNCNECFEKNKFVKIPNNMYIWATMNSADQNVNKMDTAFKRRWDFDYVNLNEYQSVVDDVNIKFNFLDSEIRWNDFRYCLNKFLSKKLDIDEDKLIGPFFISDYEFNLDRRYIKENDIKYKLFSYLKDDVLRYRVSDLFKENYTFAELIEEYDNNNEIFINDFVKELNNNLCFVDGE